MTETPHGQPAGAIGRLPVSYLLYFAGLVLVCAGLFLGSLVALIGSLCLVLGALVAWRLARLPGTDWRASHGTWLFRMFWVLLIFGIAGWYARIWFFGGPLLMLLWLWAMWRIGKGLLRWREARPIERPAAWF